MIAWMGLDYLMGPAFASFRIRTAILLGIFVIAPNLVVILVNSAQAKKAVATMWAFGQLNLDHVSRLLKGRNIVQQVSKLAVKTTQAAADISTKMNATCASVWNMCRLRSPTHSNTWPWPAAIMLPPTASRR